MDGNKTKRKAGALYAAQVFNTFGHSIVMVEPTEDENEASELAEQISKLPELQKQIKELQAEVDRLSNFIKKMSEPGTVTIIEKSKP